jgi:hypothetical protein
LPNAFEVERFDPTQAHVFGIQWNDYQHYIGIAFTHPEFPIVPDYERVPEYSITEARKKFPFIFELEERTNPILWRNFGYDSTKKHCRRKQSKDERHST